MLILLFQFICPSSTEFTSQLSTSVSLFLPFKYIHQYHFSRFHVYALIYDICTSWYREASSTWLMSQKATIGTFRSQVASDRIHVCSVILGMLQRLHPLWPRSRVPALPALLHGPPLLQPSLMTATKAKTSSYDSCFSFLSSSRPASRTIPCQ